MNAKDEQHFFLKLREELVNKIKSFPKGGIGYERVNYILKDGRVIRDVATVLIGFAMWELPEVNAGLLGVGNTVFDDSDIADIELFS